MDIASKKYGFVVFILAIVLITITSSMDNGDEVLPVNEHIQETIDLDVGVKNQLIKTESSVKVSLEQDASLSGDVQLASSDGENGDESNELIEPANYLRKDKTLNAELVLASLAEENFPDVLTELSKDISEQSLHKKQELSEILNDVKMLNSLDFQYECGKGTCAIMVPYVENKMTDAVSKAILSNLKMGAIFTKNVIKNDGYIEFRAIFGSDPKYGRTLTLNPALLSGQ